MSTFLDYLAPPLFFLGHFAFWIGLFNRLHAVGFSCTVVSRLEKAVILAAAVPPLMFLILLLFGHAPHALVEEYPLAWLYVVPCTVLGMMLPGLLLHARLSTGRAAFRVRSARRLNLAHGRTESLAGDFATRCLALPGNEIFQLEVNEKELAPPGLPEELAGLRIAHVSDLHYTGQIRRAYFEAVMEELAALSADMIVLTGDIVEKTACLEWIEPTLGRLEAPAGCWFVLGNHDKRLPRPEELRRRLTDCGWSDLGGCTHTLEYAGRRILLAGNERPWFTPLAEIPSADSEPPFHFRLALSHSPDHIPRARAHNSHLLLAGHTHGGQIRLPLLGPIVSPSWFGVRYASGVFLEPPTLMHVSRGVSGLQPLRFNCRPEISLLVLQTANTLREPNKAEAGRTLSGQERGWP